MEKLRLVTGALVAMVLAGVGVADAGKPEATGKAEANPNAPGPKWRTQWVTAP